jgi:prepilin signal peptidase PulO-like enzyme (type II secretory pathway)
MMIELGISPAATAAIGGLFGLLLGSFLNVVILRLPIQLKSDWRRDSRDTGTRNLLVPINDTCSDARQKVIIILAGVT